MIGTRRRVPLGERRGGTRWHLLSGLGIVWLATPSALAIVRWPRWWTWIAPEQTPMTWLQSVVLMLTAAASLLVAFVQRRVHASSVLAWWLLAAGLTGLAVDERFALHERIRDRFLAPHDITVPFLPWVAPGDFLVLMIGLMGLAFLPVVWHAMRPDAAAQRALVVGVLLAIVAVGMDSIDPSTWSTGAERLQQTLEEVVELGSGLALLAAVVLRLFGLLDAHLQVVTKTEPASTSARFQVTATRRDTP